MPTIDIERTCSKCTKQQVCFIGMQIFHIINANLSFFDDTNSIPVGVANACKEFDEERQYQPETSTAQESAQ